MIISVRSRRRLQLQIFGLRIFQRISCCFSSLCYADKLRFHKVKRYEEFDGLDLFPKQLSSTKFSVLIRQPIEHCLLVQYLIFVMVIKFCYNDCPQILFLGLASGF